MPDDRGAPDAYEVIVAFGFRDGEEGRVKWVETPDKKRVYDPPTGFVEEPMIGIDLLAVQTIDVLVYREPGSLTIAYCPHVNCRRYSC